MNRGKTIMLVDSSYLFHGSLQAGWHVDAKKLDARLEHPDPIWQTYYFAAATDPFRLSQTNFYKGLQTDLHFEVSVLPLLDDARPAKSRCNQRYGFTDKGVATALSTKLLSLAQNREFDTALLVLGDCAYLDAVLEVKNSGLRIDIVSWKHFSSEELLSESSLGVVFLDDMKNSIEMTAPLEAEVEKLMLPAEA